MTRLGLAALALAVLVGFVAADSQLPAKKLPVPDAPALARATALVGELYGDSLSKAKADPEERLKLAMTLLLEARETGDDPAGKYILLAKAAELAAAAGDGATALQALEELALGFDVPAPAILSLKTKALQIASAATATPEAYKATFDSAVALLDEAVQADDFDSAVALGVTCDSAARKLKSVPLVAAIRKRNDEIRKLHAEFALVKPFIDVLQKDPSDSKANLEAGKYYAVFKGNWEKGLPLLAKAGDKTWKMIATVDLSAPEAWEPAAQLAAGWAKQAEQLKGQSADHALLRAYHWYQRALAGSTIGAKDRQAVESAMLAVNGKLPPDQRVGEIAVELRHWTAHAGPVFSVSMNADGSKIASAGADGTVKLWDAKTGKELRRFSGHSGPVWVVRLAPDGKRVVSGGFDKSIRLWDPVSGREIKRLAGHDDYVRALAISANGQFLLSGGDDRLVKLWDAGGGELKTLRGHDHFVFAVAISPSGKHGLSASLDRTLRVWDLDTGSTLQVLQGHTDTVLGAAFTPDGRRALSASTDKTLRLWDLQTGKTLHVLTGHTGFVQSVSVSPDGRRALSAGQDGKVILWDVDQGKQLRVLEGHIGPVWAVAFSGDGRYAVTAGNDGTVRVWGSAK